MPTSGELTAQEDLMRVEAEEMTRGRRLNEKGDEEEKPSWHAKGVPAT